MIATLEETRINEVSVLLQVMQAQIAALEACNRQLEAKLEKLEAAGVTAPAPVVQPEATAPPVVTAPAPAPAPAPVQVHEEITEETMLVIAAAVAAYLGERAHIRVVRLVPSGAWAQQGRVSIQASHRLN